MNTWSINLPDSYYILIVEISKNNYSTDNPYSCTMYIEIADETITLIEDAPLYRSNQLDQLNQINQLNSTETIWNIPLFQFKYHHLLELYCLENITYIEDILHQCIEKYISKDIQMPTLDFV